MAAPPLLTLSDLRLGWGQALLFDQLSLTLHAGARACLVGRNGSGKSTLMKVMAGLIDPDEGSRFLQPGVSVGYMHQHPDLSGFATLGDFAISDLGPADQYKVDMAAEGLKLNLDAAPAAASGGERRRAALAKILAEAPDLMLLDEPTNHLDIEAIGWLEGHLRATRQAFVVISHDRAFLRSLTQSTIWLDRGQARQNPRGFNRFEEWRDKTFEEEDQQAHKLNRLIKAEARWAVEGISARRKRNQGRVRRLADLRAARAAAIKRQGPAAMALDAAPKSGKLVIEARGISKAYADRSILRDFSIRVQRGERVGFIGPNGAGKTTLLNLLTGQAAPDTGSVKLGTNVQMSVFDQNRATLDPDATLWDTLTQDRELGISGRNDQIMVRGSPRHVVGYLKEFLFDEGQARGPVRALSGGEKARLLLARLMAQECNLLVLDEPTNDLDVETLDLLQEIIDDFDGTVLLVSHDRDFLDRVATTSILMRGDGRAEVHAGGWSDVAPHMVRADAPAKPAKKEKPKVEKPAQKSSGLSFTQRHRLDALPGEIGRLEREIAKLEEFLMDPDLYTKAPLKFQKATEALSERQAALSAAEEEWLELETLAETET